MLLATRPVDRAAAYGLERPGSFSDPMGSAGRSAVGGKRTLKGVSAERPSRLPFELEWPLWVESGRSVPSQTEPTPKCLGGRH